MLKSVNSSVNTINSELVHADSARVEWRLQTEFNTNY